MWLYTDDVCDENSPERCEGDWMVRKLDQGGQPIDYSGATVTCGMQKQIIKIIK